MACGRPVIATNWSGPTEFVTEANGYLIQVEVRRPLTALCFVKFYDALLCLAFFFM